jgi:NAD(P)-dependent dehydrogenase (short-subunit alcohol dehydrogenase family)
MVAENKWILVTGANTGLGYELCKILLKHKHPVIVAARTQQKAEDAVARLREDTGHDAIVQPMELNPSSSSSIAAGVAHLRESRDQKVGVLVNNAGQMAVNWDQKAWDDVLAVNLIGAISLAQQLAPVIAEGGRVVNVSSTMGKFDTPGWPSEAYKARIQAADSLDVLQQIGFDAADKGCQTSAASSGGVPGVPVYRISKALLNQATAILAKDDLFTSRNVSLSVVCPGWCRTGFGGGQPNAQYSPEEGAGSIAWNVEHKDPAELNGKFWSFGKELSF